MNLKFAETLVNTDGIPGNEQAVFEVLKTELSSTVDQITKDNLGSFVSVKNGTTDLKVMLAAHMDEVGFVVSRINESGFVFFKPAGGWWPHVLLAQKLRITTRTGQKIHGVVGSKPPHIIKGEERKTVVELDDLFLDLGVNNAQEVKDLGIRIGDMITPDIDFMVMNNPDFLLAKAWDNRVGCYIMAEVMKNITNEQIAANIYGVATVQEEVGLRGAKTVTNLVTPDLAIAIDTSIDANNPKIKAGTLNAHAGKGPVLLVMDATLVAHPGLRNYLTDLANKIGIELQLDFLNAGGTDGGNIHTTKNGVPTVTLVIATRYIHSHTSIVNQNDVRQAISLVTEFVKNINPEEYQKILNS